MTSTEGERVRRVSSLANSTSASVTGTRRRTKATTMVAGPLMVMATMTLRVASPPAVFSSCPRSSSPRQLLLHCSPTTLLSASAHVSSAPLHALCLSHAWSSVRCALCEPARNARCNGRSTTTTSHHRQSLVFCCTGVVQCCSSINTPLCTTETNLFETNRQNVTVQMQNHDGNLLARSILQPLQGSAFGKMS